MKKNKPVVIHWLDSFGVSTDWDSPSKVKFKPVKTQSVGWILKETKQYIRLAPNRTMRKNGQVLGVIAIPRGAITKVEDWNDRMPSLRQVL